MPRSVGYVGDKVQIGALRTAEQAVDGSDENFDEIYVFPFVEPSDIGLPFIA